jgi:hypothetical protein
MRPFRVTRIEQNELLARIHHRVDEHGLELGRRQSVLLRVGLYGLHGLVVAEDRMRAIADPEAVENVGDLEAAELEASGPAGAAHPSIGAAARARAGADRAPARQTSPRRPRA